MLRWHLRRQPYPPPKGFTELDTLGGATSVATDINDLGLIVGYATTAGGAQHALRWRHHTTIDLRVGGTGSVAQDVNNRGQATRQRDSAGSRQRPPPPRVVIYTCPLDA